MTITGLIISSNNLDEVLISSFKGEKSSGAFESGGILMIVGGVTTLASIPLLISAGKNQKKTTMSLKGESITVGSLSYKKF